MEPAELKSRREALGMSQTELAKRFGMSRVGLSLWENGHHRIRPWVDLALRELERQAPDSQQSPSFCAGEQKAFATKKWDAVGDARRFDDNVEDLIADYERAIETDF